MISAYFYSLPVGVTFINQSCKYKKTDHNKVYCFNDSSTSYFEMHWRCVVDDVLKPYIQEIQYIDDFLKEEIINENKIFVKKLFNKKNKSLKNNKYKFIKNKNN